MARRGFGSGSICPIRGADGLPQCLWAKIRVADNRISDPRQEPRRRQDVYEKLAGLVALRI